MRRDGRTATPSLTPASSSSRAPRTAMEARAALIAADKLLRYRPIDNVYEEWLGRVAELVRATGGTPTLSFSLHRAPPWRAMKLLGRLSRLLPKKAPWPQGARPLGGTAPSPTAQEKPRPRLLNTTTSA